MIREQGTVEFTPALRRSLRWSFKSRLKGGRMNLTQALEDPAAQPMPLVDVVLFAAIRECADYGYDSNHAATLAMRVCDLQPITARVGDLTASDRAAVVIGFRRMTAHAGALLPAE